MKSEYVCVISSWFGKLMKDHLKAWFRDVFFRHLGGRSILLVDSWVSYDINAINEVTPDGKEVELLIIHTQTLSLNN